MTNAKEAAEISVADLAIKMRDACDKDKDWKIWTDLDSFAKAMFLELPEMRQQYLARLREIVHNEVNFYEPQPWAMRVREIWIAALTDKRGEP